MESIPALDSPALQELKELVPKLEADEIMVANKSRGHVGARTRLRGTLMQISKLCKAARKEIPPKAD